MKKKIFSLLFIIIISMSAILMSGCDSVINSNTPDPKPSYVIDKTSTRTPGGMILKDGALYLKDMATGEAVTETMEINQLNAGGEPDPDKQANALVEAVVSNKMPVFSYDTFVAVKLVWDGINAVTNSKTFDMSAINILQYIIKDEMTDVEKVLAIHDYLSFKVEYDMKVFDLATSTEVKVSGKPAFNVIGAIFNTVAVCDGIASAFTLLCRLEGIESVRVVGRSLKVDPQTEEPLTIGGEDIPGVTSVDHAWNKVRIDTDPNDGDDQKLWYNVDCTYDRVNVRSGSVTRAYLSHAYFLKTDSEIRAYSHGTVFVSGTAYTYSGRHEQGNFVSGLNYGGGVEFFKGDAAIVDYVYDEDMSQEEIDAVELTPFHTQYYNSLKSYDFFATKKVTVGNKDFSVKIHSTQELNELFTAIKNGKKTVGKIEVQLAYDKDVDKTSHVINAYELVKNASNSVSSSPWIRLPNDVYYIFVYN